MNGYGLQLLMSPEQISTIDWQSPQLDGGQGDQSAGLTIGQADTGNSVTGGSDGGGAPAPGPKSSIGPIEGYPETGKNAWRAANDDAIAGATAKYSSDNGYQPDDPRYVSPGLMKSWMMQESGGAGMPLKPILFKSTIPATGMPGRPIRRDCPGGRP